MTWKKRDNSKTLDEIVERNTGIPIADFLSETRKEYKVTHLDEAAALVREAVSKNVPITIYGDYDADGCTATSILLIMLAKMMGLRREGFTVDECCIKNQNLMGIIPSRYKDGYGLSMPRVKSLEGIGGLLITVDNGIAAVDEIQAAKDMGFTVLVLDHHLKREDGLLPPADVTVDPNAIPGDTFCDYCGAGLALRLAEKLIADRETLDELTCLAAIGTVADVMPLIYDNRWIVKQGLSVMNSPKCPTAARKGLVELGLNGRVKADDIGFKIGPAVNAVGRVSHSGVTAVEMFVNPEKTVAKAKELAELNETRKEMVKKGIEDAQQDITDEMLYGDAPLVVLLDSASKRTEGIVGILAGRLAEERKCPAIVLAKVTTPEGEPMLKGSGRTYGNVHLKNLLDSVSPLLYRYGGHAGAAGLSLKPENLNDFRAKLKDEYDKLPKGVCEDADTVFYDLDLTIDQITNTVAMLQRYEPFGEGNPAPVFRLENIVLTPRMGKFFKYMGADCSHLRLYAQGFDAVGFGMAEKFKEIGCPKTVDIIGNLDMNVNFGSPHPECLMMDMKKTDICVSENPLMHSWAEMLKTKGF